MMRETLTAIGRIPRRRSWLLPRFSLRVLLLAFTAFAVGFPVWFRRPYEEVELRDKVNASQFAIIRTWQRKWGGERRQHGEERWTVDGVSYQTTTYRNGQKHGPFSQYFLVAESTFSNGRVRVGELCNAGQYFDDKRDGEWFETIYGKKQTNTYCKGVKITP
jgi:hypothetical protein